MEPFRGGFLVTDGHHNRILRVQLNGKVSEQIAFTNIVPTGLAVSGNTVYMAEGWPRPPLATDALVRVNANGTFTVVESALDRPTSMEFIGNTAYVVPLPGQVGKIDNVGSPPFGIRALHVMEGIVPLSSGQAKSTLNVGSGTTLPVAEDAAGKTAHADPQTGAIITSANVPSTTITGLGRGTDVGFLGKTAYVLDIIAGDNGEIDGMPR